MLYTVSGRGFSIVGGTNQSFVVDLLSDEFVLAERVAGFTGDSVYWSFFHLLFYGTIQHKERFTSTLLYTQKRQSVIIRTKSRIITLH